MKTYECELWEDQMWRYYVRVEAKNEQEAGEKVLAGEGKVMSGKFKDGGDYAEVLETREVLKKELESDREMEELRKETTHKAKIEELEKEYNRGFKDGKRFVQRKL